MIEPGQPSTFDDIVGHTMTLDVLGRAFESGRAHHAYLLTGPPGVGKRTVARLLGRSLLCRRGRPGYPCDQCGDCRRVLAKSHPDWIEIAPEGQSIKIEVVRRLAKTLALHAFEGGARVVLVEAAERMTEEAANALLKTLEEPPARSVFLLVASNRSQLLPTIVSRCQHVPFSPLTPEQVELVLSRAGHESVAAAARYSGGSPGKAAALANEPAFVRRDELFRLFLGLERPGDPAVLEFGDWSTTSSDGAPVRGISLAQQREQTLAVLETLKILLRDLMLLRAGGKPEHLVNSDLSERLSPAARQLTWHRVSDMLEALRVAERAVAGNVTPRLVLENLASRIAAVAQRR